MKTQKGATLVGSLVAITILATTLVAVLNLQASIIRAKFFLQYDNTANLLVAEGLEIVRAIYAKDGAVSNGTHHIDYNTQYLPTPPTSDRCSFNDINYTLNNANQCDLDINSTGAYALSTAGTGNRIFHRFITITNSDKIPQVTSTVVVKNPKGGNLRVYKATIELYRID
jgi:Tfp pilus assembly protein PilV